MYTLLQPLLIAAGLGMLVGLQRERSASRLAGIRTFTLLSLLGALCAQLATSFGPWLVAAGMLGVVLFALGGNIVEALGGRRDSGQTTEIAMLVMFCIGAYTAVGPTPLAVALGAGVAVLLHMKERLHGLAGRIGNDDFRAIMHFVIVSLVILPVLPDRGYGPYGVLNPREVWWMVVLIVAISLAAYVAWKLLGARGGSVLGGVLGGLISSTATTVSYARQSRDHAELAAPAAAVILIASAVAFARVLVEIAVVAPGFLRSAGPPLGCVTAFFFLIAALGWLRPGRPADGATPTPRNPSELNSALIFAGLYALILLAVAAARDYFGRSGLYIVAVLSGLTDVDAITLSTSNLVNGGGLEADVAWRVITIAALSNLAFKAGAVALLGSRALLVRIALAYAAVMGAGIAVVLLWP